MNEAPDIYTHICITGYQVVLSRSTLFTGDCIGLPYTSVERFPIIPPYGLPELAGWYLTGQTPTFIPGKTTSLHPIGRHMGFPSHQFVLPRAFVLHHTRDKLWLRPYQFADSELDVNIPLSGVDILVSPPPSYL